MKVAKEMKLDLLFTNLQCMNWGLSDSTLTVHSICLHANHNRFPSDVFILTCHDVPNAFLIDASFLGLTLVSSKPMQLIL